MSKEMTATATVVCDSNSNGTNGVREPLLCVLASKVDSPVKVSFQYYSTLRKSQIAQKYGLSPQPKATFGFYVEILDFNFSFGLYLEL